MEQLDELRKQLEKEQNLKCEEAAKELNNVKLQVELRRHELEARQSKVEAEAAEVVLFHIMILTLVQVSLPEIVRHPCFLLAFNFQVDATTLKTNAVKVSGAAKQEELARKIEEIMKEVNFP